MGCCVLQERRAASNIATHQHGDWMLLGIARALDGVLIDPGRTGYLCVFERSGWGGVMLNETQLDKHDNNNRAAIRTTVAGYLVNSGEPTCTAWLEEAGLNANAQHIRPCALDYAMVIVLASVKLFLSFVHFPFPNLSPLATPS